MAASPSSVTDVSARLSAAAERLKAVQPIDQLDEVRGSDLARHVKTEIAALAHGRVPKSLSVHKLKSAVIVPAETYEALASLRAELQDIAEQVRSGQLAGLSQQFDALQAKLSSQASRQAADDLFTADESALNAHYKPGATETSAA